MLGSQTAEVSFFFDRKRFDFMFASCHVFYYTFCVVCLLRDRWSGETLGEAQMLSLSLLSRRHRVCCCSTLFVPPTPTAPTCDSDV